MARKRRRYGNCKINLKIGISRIGRCSDWQTAHSDSFRVQRKNTQTFPQRGRNVSSRRVIHWNRIARWPIN
jgi:hypothetical protein